MKLLELTAPPDDRAIYRSIATAAKKGAENDPPLSAPVQLSDEGVSMDKEGLAKLAAKIRAGLGSLKDGRYTVLHVGNIAYVSVNTKPVRTRAPKKAAPAAKKAAAAK